MASKTFQRPIKLIVKPINVQEQLDAQLKRDRNMANARRIEYQYAMAYAKRTNPDWTLRQRQEYARRSVEELFDY